jgi:hypothetical protein
MHLASDRKRDASISAPTELHEDFAIIAVRQTFDFPC